jgi:hypothetical protein
MSHINRSAMLWGFVAVAVGIGVAAWGFRPTDAPDRSATEAQATAPNPVAAPPEAIARYLASDAFAQLPEDARQQYFDKAVSEYEGRTDWIHQMPELAPEERERLRRNMQPLFRRLINERIRTYNALPKEQKKPYLDKMIDQMTALRQAAMERRATLAREGATSNPPAPAHRGMTPARLKQRIEETPPEERARTMQFMKDVMARMIERGLDIRPPTPPDKPKPQE